MKSDDVRYLAVHALNKVDKDKSYSNIVLNSYLRNEVSRKDKSYFTHLFYGVIERLSTLDYVIDRYSKKAIDKIDRIVVNILRLGLYELLYSDGTKNYAVVNEVVGLCALYNKVSAKGFVNGILRTFLRDDLNLKLEDIQDKNMYLSVKYACPIWIIQMLLSMYGEEQTVKFLEHSLLPPKVILRVNTLKISQDDLIEELAKEGVKACKYMVNNSLILEKGADIASLKCYQKGYFYVQDISSQMCALALEAKEGDVVFDICAAPGGKSFTLAQLTNDKAKIKSFDIHPKKVTIIEKNAKILGINSIEAMQNDATIYNEKLGYADVVLCDCVCSGLGVIGRKPEIKLKEKKLLDKLPEIQYKILTESAKYLKEDGVLVYSTCTINKNENEKVVEKFLSKNKNFVKEEIKIDGVEIENDGFITLLPHINNTDGFFIARLRRINND